MTMPFHDSGNDDFETDRGSMPQLGGDHLAKHLEGVIRTSVAEQEVSIDALFKHVMLWLVVHGVEYEDGMQTEPDTRFIQARKVAHITGKLLVERDTNSARTGNMEGQTINLGSHALSETGAIDWTSLRSGVIVPGAGLAIDHSGDGFRNDQDIEFLYARFAEIHLGGYRVL